VIRVLALVFALLLGVVRIPASAADAMVAEWQMLAATSNLSFIFGQAGSDEKGQFRLFTPQFRFDPANLAHSVFEVGVDMQSVDTGDKERDEILLSDDMFAVKQWPQAHFKTLKIERRAENEYLAEAELTIRDQTRRIPFPFRLVVATEGENPVFHLQSELSINRLDFGVGQGEWSETTWVPNEVKIRVEVRAAQLAAH
jgi:polyisoprenoid-binding protein YceI